MVLSLYAVTALAETKAQKAFLERVKSVSTIDDAHITDDALVIWPSPDVQAGLDYEAMGAQLCLEYKVYKYLYKIYEKVHNSTKERTRIYTTVQTCMKKCKNIRKCTRMYKNVQNCTTL